MEAITEVYENSWTGHEMLDAQAQNMEMLWQDFSHKLGDQVLIPLNTYQGQFPETRVSSCSYLLTNQPSSRPNSVQVPDEQLNWPEVLWWYISDIQL